MKLSVLTQDDRVILVEVESADIMESVKAILEVETGVPISQQKLLYNGREILNTVQLSSVGVSDGDLFQLQVVSPSRTGVSRPPPFDATLNSDGSAKDPHAWLRHFGNPEILPQVLSQNRALGHAIMSGDAENLQSFLKAVHEEKIWRQRAIDDPFDLEAQAKIEEAIQRANIAENEALAMEYNPAQFSSIFMLYVMMEVNNIPLKTFVDSGAQISIMSQACAERCGVMRLCDKRYHGFAMGVGKDKIVGRIHNVQLKIGPNYYMCGITVLENPRLEFIFGLDMLRRHQCSIDLKENVLRIGTDDCVVPFLPEHEVPKENNDVDIIDASGHDQAGVSSSSQAPSTKVEGSGSAMPQIQERSATPSFQGITAEPSASQAALRPDASRTSAQIPPAWEIKVSRLTELGFDRASVIEALVVCGGNEEQAAGMLFGG